MASSRLEKIGTIYSRITGLIKSGALKEEDIPIWYNVYKAFPPKYEPKYDRPAPNITIRNIFYSEDKIRAQFHKEHSKSLGTYNLNNPNIQTQTQNFICIYNNLKEERRLPEEDLFDAALDALKGSSPTFKTKPISEQNIDNGQTGSLASTFLEAQRTRNTDSTNININIKDIFREQS